MKKLVVIILALCAHSNIYAQSLEAANAHFDRYEYAGAIKEYKLLMSNGDLPTEDLKRYCYALFTVGDFTACKPISEQILKTDNVEPFFYYVNGEANMSAGQYDDAIASFKQYQQLDDEFDVNMRLKSCEEMRNWVDEEYVSNESNQRNDSKANISGTNYLEYELQYHETGYDSAGVSMDALEVDNGELILSYPLLVNSEEQHRLTFEGLPQNASIPSITFDTSNNTVFFTVMQPLAASMMDKAGHIYTGKLNGDMNVTDITLWEYAGYEDTSSCAFPTINASGNLMVFTKMSGRTKGADLFISQKANGTWSKPTPFAALNTNSDDMYPIFQDDSLLSFASDGRSGYGKLDIYLADMTGSNVDDIRHPKAPVNSTSDDFNFVYTSTDLARYTSNRSGGKGDDDIYTILFKEEVIPDPIPVGPSEFELFVENWVDDKVYFELNKFHLEKDMHHLKETIDFLNKYPKSKLVITGHADTRGTVEYNLNLGQSRADRVKSALVDLGVKPAQIEATSLGEAAQPVECDNCSEEEHALNRVAIITLHPAE